MVMIILMILDLEVLLLPTVCFMWIAFALTLISMLDYLGIEKGRTRVEWVSAAEGQKFAETMNSFVETIYSLGENKRLEDLRCKTE